MKRILVIEDAPEVREVIEQTLQAKGWEPVVAESGEQGLAAAQRQIPDLILCDIRMPGKDGFEVLRELRENPATATIPFIFLTGLTDRPHIRQGMELGADDYLLKPFTVRELVAAVEARLQKHKQLEQTAEEKLSSLRESLSLALPHEFVTPLNSILGFSELLRETPNSPAEDVREFANHIHSAAQRLKQVVEKFLLYAQLEVRVSSGAQIPLAERPLSCVEEVLSVASRRTAQEFSRQADLHLETENGEAPISGPHLERVARELMENALKFSEPGSSVWISSNFNASGFTLQVKDSGKGLSPEQIRALGANVQLDRRLQEQQGTGLGLAIVQRLAELYGGRVDIESELGVGTTVRFQLPANGE